MAPASVALASRSVTSIALGVLNVGLVKVLGEQIDAVHGVERPIEPVEVERQKARGVARRQLLRRLEEGIEALRRTGQAGLLKHGLVVKQQRLGDVEGQHVVVALVGPVREVVGVEAVARPRPPP